MAFQFFEIFEKMKISKGKTEKMYNFIDERFGQIRFKKFMKLALNFDGFNFSSPQKIDNFLP